MNYIIFKANPALYNEVRRPQIRAELDIYARLYGLTRNELRYTTYGVDPKEIHG